MPRHSLRGIWTSLFCLYTLACSAMPGAAASALPSLQFQVFTHTGVPLSGILWTGRDMLYTAEGRRAVYATDAAGHRLHTFVTVPQNNGEMRCVYSPGDHGFPAQVIFCHAATGQIYQISQDGATTRLLATIPTPHGSDGGLTFDTSGAFGYGLLAATGGSDSGPGAVYAVDAKGAERLVGSYAGPGGAENLAMMPPGLGSAAGQVVITIDRHDHLGRLLSMDGRGRVRTLVGGLQYGLNPIVAILPGRPEGSRPPAAGLYLADWTSHDVLFAPAAQLSALNGSLIVGTERRGLLYLVQVKGSGYQATMLQTNLHAADYNLEGASFIGA